MPTTAGFQGAADTIAAALEYNKLSPSEGYDAFDVDEDGKVSWEDLKQAVETLRLELAEADVQAFFEQLDESKSGHISKDAWQRTMRDAHADTVLKSRGVAAGEEPVGGEAGSGGTGVNESEGTAPVGSVSDTIGALLAWNELTPRAGYEAFDADQDGKISLKDLQVAAATYSLTLDTDEMQKWHESVAKGGAHIAIEDWVREMEGANTKQVLQSRGVEAAPAGEPAPAQGEAAPLSKDAKTVGDLIMAALRYNGLDMEK
eukprot:2020730-Rhodomonas_salina.1